jgi:hypothetical protein
MLVSNPLEQLVSSKVYTFQGRYWFVANSQARRAKDRLRL